MISSWSSELPWSVSATSSWLTCCVRQSRSWHRIQSGLARSRPSASSRDSTVTPHLCKPSSSRPSSSLVVLERYRHSIFSVVSPESHPHAPTSQLVKRINRRAPYVGEVQVADAQVVSSLEQERSTIHGLRRRYAISATEA